MKSEEVCGLGEIGEKGQKTNSGGTGDGAGNGRGGTKRRDWQGTVEGLRRVGIGLAIGQRGTVPHRQETPDVIPAPGGTGGSDWRG